MTALTNTLCRPSAPTRGGLLSRLARGTVLRRLREMTRDRLVIVEGDTRIAFGPGGGLTARVTVHHPRFYRRLAIGGALSVGESYLDGDWDADDLTSLFRIVLRNGEALAGLGGSGFPVLERIRHAALRARRNSKTGSRRNIREHYDLGNDLFALFLDETMTYSAAIFPHPGASLFEAQVAKLDRTCRKLALRPEDHVLEIGTGWGSFAIHAAREYGVRVTSATISNEQFVLARRRVEEAGVADRVRVVLSDYRDLDGEYDKLVSIEMIEAVGHEYLDTYFGKCASLLSPSGSMLLQAIVMPDRGYAAYLRSVDFIQRHVFPGGCLPSLGAIAQSTARATDLRIVNVEDLTPHYAETLRRWRARFSAKLSEVRALGYPERFIRLWTYYLTYCEAAFEERYTGDLQLLLQRPGCRDEPVLPPIAVSE